MTINTKYNKGDIVFVLKDGEVFEFQIAQIKFETFRGDFIGYAPYEHPFPTGSFYSEDRCFVTKEELFKYLYDNATTSLTIK